MYRKEYTETIFRTGSHTSRKSSVKQHEMAALREMEQMILAAEAVPAGAEALERATAHLEQFLQQVRQKRILTKNSVRWKRSGSSLKTATWRNGFLRNVARFGDREALIEPESGTVWTYTQLNAEANRLSHALLRAGLQKGDVVMVQLHNCPEFVFAYLACHKTGMVFCPVNFRLSAKEITDCMDNSRPKVFLLEPETQAEVDMALRRTAHAPQILLTTDARAAHAYAGFTADCPATEPELPWKLSVYDETPAAVHFRYHRQTEKRMPDQHQRGAFRP